MGDDVPDLATVADMSSQPVADAISLREAIKLVKEGLGHYPPEMRVMWLAAVEQVVSALEYRLQVEASKAASIEETVERPVIF